MIQFEYDQKKSSSNLTKHGIDVDTARALWLDPDLSKIKRPNQQQRRVNVDFPTWMIESLDREAGRLGVTRQSIIKVWLAVTDSTSCINFFTGLGRGS